MSMGIMALMGGVALVMGLVQSMLYTYPPYVTARARDTFGRDPNMLPPLENLVRMLWKGDIDTSEYQLLARQCGFETELAMKLWYSSRTMLQADDYITVWRRGEIPEEELNRKLTELGMSTDDIVKAKIASEYFPNPQDLIRFAVREVYTPAVVEKFGQMEDLPDAFLEAAAKAGVPKEQARNFWGAHWLLPSTGQAFEMFQRDVIDDPTLDMLLKALDIMPFWRDKLKQIAYLPLTRVDVRRMHAMGVLTDEQTYDAYRYHGNSPENAKKMLEFTKQYNSDETKGITRASVMKAYTIGLLNFEQLKEYLGMLGYGEEIVNFWADMAEYEKSVAELEVSKTELEAQYKSGLIDLSTYRQSLEGYDVPAHYVATAISQAVEKQSEKAKLPSRTDLEGWLKIGVITDKYYKDEMLRIGYQQEHIEFYLTEIAIEQDTSKRKYLPITVYQRWLKAEIITTDQFISLAQALNISDIDIERMIREATEEKVESGK